MSRPTSLSEGLRRLTRVIGGLSVLVGVPSFFAPAWAAGAFPWKVSVFVAMTIGAWCLGNAGLAFLAARRWAWAHARAQLIYLWVFSLLELAVVVAFLDLLKLDAILTYPYLAMLIAGVAAAVWGLFELAKRKPEPEDGPPLQGWTRGGWIVFAVFVIFLAGVAFLRPGSGTSGRIFPEALSPFTISAFGAFYLSLGLAAIPALLARTTATTHGYLRGGLWLLVFITAATAVHWSLFDVTERLTHLIYPGIYVAALVVDLVAIRIVRR